MQTNRGLIGRCPTGCIYVPKDDSSKFCNLEMKEEKDSNY